MRKFASDARTFAARTSAPLRRQLLQISNRPLTGSAVLLVLALLSITTDVAARFGLVPFGVVLAVYLRRARPNRVAP